MFQHMSRCGNLSLKPRTTSLHFTPTLPSITFHVITHRASMMLFDLRRGHRLKHPKSYRPTISLTFAFETSCQNSWISSFAMSLGNFPTGAIKYTSCASIGEPPSGCEFKTPCFQPICLESTGSNFQFTHKPRLAPSNSGECSSCADSGESGTRMHSTFLLKRRLRASMLLTFFLDRLDSRLPPHSSTSLSSPP